MAINTGNKKTKLYISNKEVSKVYLGSSKIYPSGNTVTYHIDTEIIYQEDVDEGCSCLSPASFTPSKPGWIFAGWRSDTTADGAVLSNMVMGDSPVNLYAVFKQIITISFDGNDSTGGHTQQQQSPMYYNNRNTENARFILPTNSFTKTGYNFLTWAIGSPFGIQYSEGEHVDLSSDTMFYAVWSSASFNPPTSSIIDYINVESPDGEYNAESSDCEDHAGAPQFSAGVWHLSEGNGGNDDRTFIISPKTPYTNIKTSLHWKTFSYDSQEGSVGVWVNGSELYNNGSMDQPEKSGYITVEGSSITIRVHAESDGWDGHWKTTSSICMYDVTLS